MTKQKVWASWEITKDFNLQAGNYVWQTYEEAYEVALKIGSAIRQTGVNLVSWSRCLCTLESMAVLSFLLK